MKKIELTNIFFYITFIAVITIAAFFDRMWLRYALPVMILSIGVIYITKVQKINVWYLISLLSMIFCDILIYSDFVTNFSMICLLTACYFLMCTLAFRKYVHVHLITKETFTSIPIIVSSALIVYLIISIFQLLKDMVIDAIPEVIVCLFFSTLFIFISYLIYKQDVYKDALKLIIVACLCIFIVSLLPINEMFYSSNIFTILINIAHVLSIYLFMLFLTNTDPEKDISKNKKKYL